MLLRSAAVAAVLLTFAACNCGDPGGGGDAGSGGGSAAGGGAGGGGGGGTAADAGADPDAGCSIGSVASLASPGNLSLFGQVSYYADGGELPPGTYEVAYVTGCMKYGGGQDWTIHAYADGHIAWWLVGGRAFCSWICPYHLLAEWAEMIHLKLARLGLAKDHVFHRGLRTVLAGFDHHLTKPVDPDALLRLVHTLVAQGSNGGEPRA